MSLSTVLESDEVEVDPMLGENPEETTEETPQEQVIETSGEDEDSAVVDTGSEDAESEPEAITDDWRELAHSYGMDDATIDKFGTRDALQNTLVAMDRQLAQGQQQQFQPEMQQPAQVQQALDDLKLKLDDLPDDDPARVGLELVAKELNKVRQEQQEFMRFQEQQRAQEFERQLEAEYDEVVDAMNDAMFGKRASLSLQRQFDNRREGYQTFRLMLGRAYANGVSNVDRKALAERAINATFPERIVKKQQQQVTEAVLKRSSKRTGAGSRGPKQEAEIPLADSPELDAIYNRLLRGE